jgi:hypothetical protein
MRYILVISLIFIGFFQTKAQDTINLINGSRLLVQMIDTNLTSLRYSFKKNEKLKIETIEKDEVFSVNYFNGKEVVVYAQDTLSEDSYMTIDEMRAYIAGERDAIKGFKSPVTTITSAAVGVASGLVPLLLLSQSATLSLLSPIPPAAYVGISGARWIKISRNHVSNPKYLKSESYIEGYDHAARSKRIQNALIAGGCGLLVGTIARFFLYSSVAKK